jgi:hypothetical protein
MCAKQSLRQPARRITPLTGAESKLVPENTVRSGYHNWRSTLRSVGRSPVRNDAGRNALSGVKVSSPVKQHFPEWPSKYEVAKAISADQTADTLGVQVHGMYRRLSQELGRSPSVLSGKKANRVQDVMFNQSKLSHYYHEIIGQLFKWLNRRSQKRSYTWDAFAKRLMFKPLPKPPGSAQLIDITSGIVPELKRNMRSRMRKSRTYGSKRSPGLSPVFT